MYINSLSKINSRHMSFTRLVLNIGTLRESYLRKELSKRVINQSFLAPKESK